MAARASLVLGLVLVTASACVQNDGSRNPLKKLVTVSEADERETGASADGQFQEVLPLVDDPIILGFVNDLGQDIVRRIEPQPFIYRFRVVVEPSLNAFALPGGYIYFHTGTLLKAGSLEELAGVMAHEIAHVKGRHYARMVEAAAIPSILTRLAAIGLAVATENPAPVVIGESVNVALQLRFTREVEAEADTMATTFLARSGHDPEGMVYFFQRIVAEQKRASFSRLNPPPYLYSHPDVEQRIDTALTRAEGVTITGTPDPSLEQGFRQMQLRLAYLLRSGSSVLRAPAADRSVAAPFLARAEEQRKQEEFSSALAVLAEAQLLEPNDPRVPYQRGELLAELGRDREAIVAWRRALMLDPSVGLNYYHIGHAYKKLGDRVNATFYLEQAARRFEPGGALRGRTEREIERLTFPVITEAGLADGREDGGDTVAGLTREEFWDREDQAFWWGRVGARYAGERSVLRVRWIDPSGRVVQDAPAEPARRPYVRSSFALSDAALGEWTVEVLVEDDIVDRRSFRVRSSSL